MINSFQVSPLKPSKNFSSSRWVPRVTPTPLFLLRIANYKAHHAVFFEPPLISIYLEPNIFASRPTLFSNTSTNALTLTKITILFCILRKKLLSLQNWFQCNCGRCNDVRLQNHKFKVKLSSSANCPNSLCEYCRLQGYRTVLHSS